MADKDPGDGDGPSLEMPSLGSLFKRKKKSVEQDDAPTVSREELDAVVRGRKPAADQAEAASPAVEPTTHEPEAEDEQPATVPPVEDEQTTVVPTVEDEDEDAPTAVVPTVDGDSDTEHTTVLPETRDDAGDELAPAQPADTDDDQPLFADEVRERAPQDQSSTVSKAATVPEAATVSEAAHDRDAASGAGAVAHVHDETDEATGDDADDEEERPPRARRELALPALPGRVAAAITGLVVGALAVAMTYLAVQGCEKVKGTSSCGTPGFFLLLAIMILLVVLGSSLLKAWQISDPGSTSFMAVGLVAVVALLFLIQVIFSPWMVLVIPLVGGAAFVVSHWLTSLFVDEDSPLEEATPDAATVDD
ncbi:hypothetical protein ncot_18010 [Nocardioides sp. JQ2195]|uniref:hypothetical protein n=1 Tax=Nocardioides sp. JQ2195 TaxID=2592334 RepID=UPI00143EDCFA|nr:hypothetical protein [Nocardioides sp. JQ2195]QIX28273.1 hypothetical protein ncot_18010 [Nocardioides sp. JQ2195]